MRKTTGIIGGGIAGCATALELAENGMQVTLFESTDQLMSQTSDASSSCFGAGFYYSDKNAATKSLEICINLLKYLKEKTGKTFQIQDNSITNRIHYVITKNCIISQKQILETFEHLKMHYAKLIMQDPHNAVLGPVDMFYTIVDKSKFIDILDTSNILMVVDTCDTLFDWPMLKKYLTSCLLSHPNITICFNTEVKAIQKLSGADKKTSVIAENGKNYQFDYIVNAAWKNLSRLMPNKETQSIEILDNYITGIAIINLPKPLHNQSFFIGYDNICFLTSTATGIGFLTYAPVSCMARFSSSAHAEEDDFIREHSSYEQKKKLGNAIISGALSYIPALKGSTLIDLKIGVIKKTGALFKSVNQIEGNIFTNEASQHTFWKKNAKEIVQMIKNQENIDSISNINNSKILSKL
jgi:hypothetical protein